MFNDFYYIRTTCEPCGLEQIFGSFKPFENIPPGGPDCPDCHMMMSVTTGHADSLTDICDVQDIASINLVLPAPPSEQE